MRTNRPNDLGIPSLLLHQAHSPSRVIVGMLLVVKIVQQPGDPPFVGVFAKLLGIPFQADRNTQTVPSKRRAVGMGFKQSGGFGAGVWHGLKVYSCVANHAQAENVLKGTIR